MENSALLRLNVVVLVFFFSFCQVIMMQRTSLMKMRTMFPQRTGKRFAVALLLLLLFFLQRKS